MARKPKRWTPNQVVAHNLRRARLLHEWTQDEAAERIEPYLGERWSRVVFSAAERSVRGERVRQFTADDLMAFAAGFGLPVSFFLTPPQSADRGTAIAGTLTKPAQNVPELIAGRNARVGLTPQEAEELVTASADARVTALVERRIRTALGPYYPGEKSRTRDEQVQPDGERLDLTNMREAQKAAGRVALRQGAVIRPKDQEQAEVGKKGGKP